MLPVMVFALRAARLFDGVEVRGSGRMQVVVDGGQIVEVGPPTPLAVDVPVEDLGDVTLLPGLVDAHTHLTWDATREAVARVSSADEPALIEQARAAAAAALGVGITTVRDLGDRGYVTLGLRDEWRRDPRLGVEVVAAGPPITTRGGHCGFLGGEAESDEELRRAVAERVERGVDVVKVMATGGEVTPGGKRSHESQFERNRLQILAAAAHAAGVPITAHAHGAQGATDAVAAGFDAIEHGGFWTETSAEVTVEALDLMARNGTFVVLTPAGRGLMDPAALPPAIGARLPALKAVAQRMRDAGVRLVFASDSGIGPGKEPDVLAFSLPRAVHGGFTAVEALRAMTSEAAAVCGLGQRKGRIAPGYDADLLAVAGNPFDDPGALGRTHTVVRAGTVVPTADPAAIVPAPRTGGVRTLR